jgi:2'-5' RNA ligase
MEQLRVFVALDIPAALQGRLGPVTDRLRRLPGKARWVAAPHLHLTLRFLGEVSRQKVALATAAVERVAARHTSFPLGLAGLGVFPEQGPPSVVWVGVSDGRHELSELQADLEAELELAGFPPEDRPFTPHLTLARLRDADGGAWRAAIRELGREPVLSFEVREVQVIRSELTRRGPVYTPLSAASLSDPGV